MRINKRAAVITNLLHGIFLTTSSRSLFTTSTPPNSSNFCFVTHLRRSISLPSKDKFTIIMNLQELADDVFALIIEHLVAAVGIFKSVRLRIVSSRSQLPFFEERMTFVNFCFNH
jgi:hypothetical protein